MPPSPFPTDHVLFEGGSHPLLAGKFHLRIGGVDVSTGTLAEMEALQLSYHAKPFRCHDHKKP
jgi:hypothetical protein